MLMLPTTTYNLKVMGRKVQLMDYNAQEEQPEDNHLHFFWFPYEMETYLIHLSTKEKQKSWSVFHSLLWYNI